MKTGDTLIPF